MRPGHQVAPGAAETPVADRLYRAIDVALLISSGWDPATQVFAPDREHPLLGYPVCRVVGLRLGQGHLLHELADVGLRIAGHERPPEVRLRGK